MDGCDSMNIFITGSFTIAGVILGALLFHFLAKSRDSSNYRNQAINNIIRAITDEINRIKTEEFKSPGPVGTVAKIETLVPQIEVLGIEISKYWEEFYENEHRRKSPEAEKKKKAIDSLENIIGILNDSKT